MDSRGRRVVRIGGHYGVAGHVLRLRMDTEWTGITLLQFRRMLQGLPGLNRQLRGHKLAKTEQFAGAFWPGRSKESLYHRL